MKKEKKVKAKPKKTQKTGILYDELQANQILIIVVMILAVAGICFGFTLAWVKMNEKEVQKEEAKVGSLEVIVEDTNSASVVMDDPYPMNEAGGLSTDPYKFILKNTGSYSMNYSLNLIDDTEAIAACATENEGVACKLVSIDSIRYSIKKDGVVLSTGLLSDSKGVIDMGIIPAPTEDFDGTVSYELKLWVDFDTTEDLEGAKFYGKIDVRVQTGD